MKQPFEVTTVKSWAVQAGEIALKYYQTQLAKKQKDDNSPVTEADETVEAFLIRQIQQSASDCAIIAEESGSSWQEKEFTWAIDPIDGTRVFINGIPLWCISLGLLRHGEPFRGVVYLPATRDIYYTDNDGVPFWNNRPLIGTMQTTWDSDSFIAVPSGAHRYFEIDFKRLRALGAVATHHVYVASGVAVAALHRAANIWDVAGAHAVLQAAGGIAVYLDGAPLCAADMLSQQTARFKGPILAGHPSVVEKLLHLITPCG